MQILDALPTVLSERILCVYQNITPEIQILRISNIANWYFERVVFPSDRLLFETVLDAQLEVYSYSTGISSPASSIPCRNLVVQVSFPICL